MSQLPDSRKVTVDALNDSLCEYEGIDVFSSVSATHTIHSVRQLQQTIRNSVPPDVFPQNRKGINEEGLLKVKAATRPVLTKWLATAMDIFDVVIKQFEGAMELDSDVLNANNDISKLLREKTENQQTIIQLQQELIKQKNDQLSSFKDSVKKRGKILRKHCVKDLCWCSRTKETGDCCEKYQGIRRQEQEPNSSRTS